MFNAISIACNSMVTECQELIEKWKIPNIINEEIDIPKNEWKGILKRETKIQNGFLLTKLVKKSSKLETMKNETFEEKKYLTEMTMYDCRIHFMLRSRMFSCKMNFLNDPKFKADMWRCDSCEKCIDSQSHILYCPAYIQLREEKSLSSDQDIVDYFKEVLRIRTKLNIDK